MGRQRLDLILFAAAALALGAVGGAVLASGPAGLAGVPLAIHTAAKWLLLGAAVWLSLKNAGAMGSGTPIGRAWRFFGLGIASFLVAELGEAFYQFVLGILNPFPSVLDVFYVAGYPLLVVGLVGFVRAYAAVGYRMGSLGGGALLTLILVAGGLVLVWPVLAGIEGPTPFLEKALAAAYPLLDIALLVAVALLVRGAWHFGGGRAWEVWALILAGLIVMIAGDFRYAYFAAGGEERVDPYSEMLFVVSYALLARGALRQRDLMES